MLKIEIEPFDSVDGTVYDITVTTENMKSPRGVVDFAISFGVTAENEVEALDKIYVDIMLALRVFFQLRKRKVSAVAQDPLRVDLDKLDKEVAHEFNVIFGSCAGAAYEANQDFSVLGDK